MNKKKCQCGSYATLNYKSKQKCTGNKVEIIHNVPVYICSECNFSFMTGSDSKQFASSGQTDHRLK